ncbi:MAG: protein kinase domain-containing protein [Acidobacteriota bacterium]
MTENEGNKPQRIGSEARLEVSSSPTRTQDLFSSAEDRSPGAVSFSSGQQIGPYRIVRCLGRGGMGEVYEAEDQESGRHVALKILNKSLGTPRDIERFLREGRLAASISHPNSVYIFGTEELQGTPVIAMELVKGGTLKERVEQGPVGAAEAVDIILQIIAGLRAAEAAGILHRDIKPANCFIDTNGTAKIGDFGLSISTEARAETQLTMAGSFIGTPAFASPEQPRGDPLDVRSDIYSVGATLYYLLCGRPPFEASNAIKLVSAIIQQVPESPAKLRPGLPAELAAVVLRCLEKDRSKRFSSYGDLRDKLLPLGSAAVLPANLAVRFLAGFIDAMITSAVILPWMIFLNIDFRHPSRSIPLVLGGTLVTCVYYGVLEGRWGASVGKLACRLRVIGPDRSVPGVPRALLRAAVSVAPATLLQLVVFRAIQWSESQRSVIESTLWIRGALLFVTARRSNGFAGIHELISRTRVVSKVLLSFRPIQKAVRGPQAREEVGARVGPYSVIGALRKAEGSEVLVGHDERLRRNVWIELVHVLQTARNREIGVPSRVTTAMPNRRRSRPPRPTNAEITASAPTAASAIKAGITRNLKSDAGRLPDRRSTSARIGPRTCFALSRSAAAAVWRRLTSSSTRLRKASLTVTRA